MRHLALADIREDDEIDDFVEALLDSLGLPREFEWNEEDHPRHEAGSSEGGRFAPKGEGGGAKHPLAQEGSTGEKSLSPRERAERQTLIDRVEGAAKGWVAEQRAAGKTLGRKELAELSRHLGETEGDAINAIIDKFNDYKTYEQRPMVHLCIGDETFPDVWLLGWREGVKEVEGTPIHDHGTSEAGIYVHRGAVTEHIYAIDKDQVGKGIGSKVDFRTVERGFDQKSTAMINAPYIHDIYDATGGSDLSVTVHSYFPALKHMRFYKVEGDKLVQSGEWDDRAKKHSLADYDRLNWGAEQYGGNCRGYHGDHDQDDHGNWAHGQGSLKSDSSQTKDRLTTRTLDDFKGEYPEGGYDSPEVQAYYARRDEWYRMVREDLSFGRLTPKEARALGYTYTGQSDSQEQWQPLPQELWHVTTATDAVNAGGLKSRDELKMQSGVGLGGGSSNTISFTADPKIAEGIYRGILEAREIAAGNVSAQQMLDAAFAASQSEKEWGTALIRGFKKDWKRGDPYPYAVDTLLRGVDYTHKMFITAKDVPPGGTPVFPTHRDANNEQRYNGYELPMTAEQRADQTFDFYKRWAAYREYEGKGPLDPLFFLTDAKALAKIDPKQISIGKFKPVAGAQGFKVSALGEWRTYTGRVVKPAGNTRPQVKLFHLAGTDDDHDQSDHAGGGEKSIGDTLAQVGRAEAAMKAKVDKVLGEKPEGYVIRQSKTKFWTKTTVAGDVFYISANGKKGYTPSQLLENVGRKFIEPHVPEGTLDWNVDKFHLSGTDHDHDQSTHGKGGGGGEKSEGKPLEVYLTPNDVEPFDAPGGEAAFKLKSQPGAFYRGAILARESLPETLYHVTTAKDAVEQTGYLLGHASLGGGMGGGNGLAGVSFTTSKDTAEFIAREITRSATLAQTVRTREQYAAKLDEYVDQDYRILGGNDPAALRELVRAKDTALENFDANLPSYIRIRQEGHEWAKGDPYAVLAAETYSTVYLNARDSLVWAQTKGERAARLVHPLRNPLLMGGTEARSKQRAEQISIIPVNRNLIPQGALVREGTDDFLQEIRVHADIPLRAGVLKFSHDYEFCPTGPGGGIDPSCSPGGESRAALQKHLVDYKAERELTGPGTVPITDLLPKSKTVGYLDVPGIDRMHGLMHVEPTLQTDPKAYVDTRDRLFKGEPLMQVPIEALTFTQPKINTNRAQELATKVPEQLELPVHVVRSGSKFYLMNGHHRVIGSLMTGRKEVAANVLDLNRPHLFEWFPYHLGDQHDQQTHGGDGAEKKTPEFKIEETHKRGKFGFIDKYHYRIKVDGKLVGGFTGDLALGRGGENAFHMAVTEITDEKLRGTGLFQAAVQQVADKFKGGLFVYKWESSAALQKALPKMPTFEFEPEEKRFWINPSTSAKKFHLPGQHDQQTHNPHLGSDKKVEMETKFLKDRAVKAEPLATKALKEVVEKYEGKLEGLDFRVKSEESLARKIAARARANNMEPGDVAATSISDALRYTAVLHDDKYAPAVQEMLSHLENQGFKIDKVKNYWKPGDDYNGINVSLRNSDDLKVELQFHTPDSFHVKEKESHPLYEKMRVATPEVAKQLKQQMVEIWNKVKVPAGVMTLGVLATT